MTEWWSYGLSDFLMFSPQAYWRLLARYNAAWWPAQGLGALASLALPWLLWRGSPRGVLLLLALAWAWVGWAFHWQRYTEIFLGAAWLAGACWVQAALLAAGALLPRRTAAADATMATRAGALLVLLAVLYPLLAPASGHPWAEAEVFAFLPDPTALATAGCLLALPALPRPQRTVLAVLPLLALGLAAATRYLVG